MRRMPAVSKPRIHFQCAYILVVLLSAFAIPFSGSTHAAAQSMNHADHDRSTAICASYCAKSTGGPAQEQGVLNEHDEQDREPAPSENTQYYSQFIRPAVPRSIKPSPRFDTNPLRPPDRAAWLVKFRF